MKPIDWQQRVAALPSCVSVHPNIRVGDRMVPTRDMATEPGLILLLHAEEKQVFRDYQLVREMEQEPGFYVVQSVEDVDHSDEGFF